MGRHVCKLAHEAGHTVRATDRTKIPELPVNVEVETLMNREACYRLVDGVESIIHLGNIPRPDESDPQGVFTQNCSMNVNLFQAALEAGVKQIIFASSVQVIRGTRTLTDDRPSVLPYLPVDGETPPCPDNTYGLSKLAAENMLQMLSRDHGISTVSLRFPGLFEGRHPWFLHSIIDGKDFIEQYRRWVRPDEVFGILHQSDAAELVLCAVEKRLPGYRCFIPASRQRVLYNLSPSELAAKFFPGVPVRKDLDKLGSLNDLDEIYEAYGWKPGTVFDMDKAAID